MWAWSEGWWGLPVTVGDEIAPLLGAPRGSVTAHGTVTLAVDVALSCLDFAGRRNRIVVPERDFPTLHYAVRAQEGGDALVEVIPSEDPVRLDERAVCRAIDARTSLVVLSHVLFRSAWVVDVAPIVERARETGARVLLGVHQSAGSVPVDVTRLGVDFAGGGTLKWLCGGPGVAFLYVRPDLHGELEPALTGWQADRAPFEFQPGAVRYREDAWRFLNGTLNVPALQACRPGLRILRKVGGERIREKSGRQTTRLVDRARARGWSVTAAEEPERRGGTVALRLPHAFEVSLELLARDVIVDYRPEAGIRVSPHFYNSDEECDRVLEEAESVLRTGAWRSHEGAPRRIT